MEHFDIAIIGTGSANSLIGPEFDHLRIALIEESVFGGTCLNRGCIPTKMFVHTSDIAAEVAHAGKFGLSATLNGVDWRAIVDRVFNRIDPIAQGGRDYREQRCENVTVFSGRACFSGLRELTIALNNGQSAQLSATHVVIGVGARAHDPLIPGLADVGFHTSDSIMRLSEFPKRLAIIGGGFIAAEFAHIFSALGSVVTQIQRGGQLLSGFDVDLSKRFTECIEASPIDLILNATVEHCVKTGEGIELTLNNGSTVTCDAVLVATGRTPNGDQLNLESSGIEMDGQRIKVDARGATTCENVWALGDVSSPYQLKHVANHECKVVKANLVSAISKSPVTRTFNYKAVPAAVFTNPQIATVGLTEQQAREQGYDVAVKIQNYSDVAYGWALEDTTGFAKVIADKKTHLILGAHIMGPHASVVIGQIIQAMAFDQKVSEVGTGQYFIHPALGELVENALLGLVDQLL